MVQRKGSKATKTSTLGFAPVFRSQSRDVLHSTVVFVHQAVNGPAKQFLPAGTIRHDEDHILCFVALRARTGKREDDGDSEDAEQITNVIHFCLQIAKRVNAT